MRFQFDATKNQEVLRKHGVSLEEAREIFDQAYLVDRMPIKSKSKPTADEIAAQATRGEEVSAFFTNQFTVMRPVRRVNVDLTQGMLRELDARAARLNVSRQAVIKTLLRQALDTPARKRQAG